MISKEDLTGILVAAIGTSLTSYILVEEGFLVLAIVPFLLLIAAGLFYGFIRY